MNSCVSRLVAGPPVVALLVVGLSLAGCSLAGGQQGDGQAVTSAGSPTPAGSPSSGAASSPEPSSSARPTVPPSRPVTSCPEPAGHFVDAAPGRGRTVALTFDDGPGPADVQIARVLAEHHVHATFYETGANVRRHPGITRLLAAQGHLIGNHTWHHEYPGQVASGWSVGYLTGELRSTSAAITALTGRPVCHFRPPGGFRTNVLPVATALRMSADLWSTDSEDWRQPHTTTPAATAAIVRRATAAGGAEHPVVLMHSAKASHEPDTQVDPNRGNTVAALPQVIAWYRSHGYTFVRMDGAG